MRKDLKCRHGKKPRSASTLEFGWCSAACALSQMRDQARYFTQVVKRLEKSNAAARKRGKA